MKLITYVIAIGIVILLTGCIYTYLYVKITDRLKRKAFIKGNKIAKNLLSLLGALSAFWAAVSFDVDSVVLLAGKWLIFIFSAIFSILSLQDLYLALRSINNSIHEKDK